MKPPHTALLALILAVCSVGQLVGQSGLVRKGVRELVEAASRFGGREASREMAEAGWNIALRQLVERVARDGGDDAIERIVRLTRAHGVDAIRAMDNASDIPAVLKAVEALPPDVAAAALRRLAAGPQGRELAEVVAQQGQAALRAEVRHPGVGGKLVRQLDADGARLSLEITTEQAILLARHGDDIGRLPPQQRHEVLSILESRFDQFFAWLGEFALRHPGKTIFTAAGTTIFLAHGDRILGGRGEIIFDTEGNPVYVEKSGMMERVLLGILRPFAEGISRLVAPVLAIGVALWFGISLRRKFRAQPCPGQAQPQAPDSPDNTTRRPPAASWRASRRNAKRGTSNRPL